MSSPSADDHATDKRRSGRVSKPTQFLGIEHPAGAKRKRGTASDEDRDNSDEDETSADDDEPDEEELREQRANKSARKPASKKARTNGTIPIRGTTQAKRQRKKTPGGALLDARKVSGLYAELFSGDKEVDEVVGEWLQRFEAHESSALAEIINFVLRSCGCESEVTNYDIEDVDSATNKLADLQEEFQAQNVTDYPLIARTKFATTLKSTLVDFFSVLIKSIDAANVLFANVELIENVQVWLSIMAAAQNRPFRHTATVASLAVITALCEIGKDLATAAATARRQSENMKKGKGANKKRASGLDKDAQDAQQKQTLVDAMIKDWFDTIYIHRYRDIDPKIRVDCVEALGGWIVLYPDVFFDAQHLRYLGWILSDSTSQARHEVIKQLLRLYEKKDRLAGLKVFTERFRERMVEMAALDSEPSVRSSAIQLLDLLRDAGYLEPDDIETIGRLIFDSEARVRKAVVPFFLANVNELYETKVEDLGGIDTITEEAGDASESSDRPGLPWLQIKCLAETLDSYDANEPSLSKHAVKGPGNNYRLHAEEVESRFITVGESLYPAADMIHDWNALGSYLVYDTSDVAQNGSAAGVVAQIKDLCKLSAREEYLLLEVLNVSIRQHVTDLVDAASEKRGKKTKRQREELVDKQEQSARQITSLIPQLLRRFGDSPQTALAVLRLERIVSLDAFADFQQDATTYKSLLDDIEKQFMSHGDEEVMTEASRALLRAKNYQDLGDVTEEKIEELWEESIETFRRLSAAKYSAKRGGISPKVLDALTKTVCRLERLSSISNPITHLQSTPEQGSARRSRGADSQSSVFDLLTGLVRRAVLPDGEREDRSITEAEDTLSTHAAQTLGLYLLWSTSSIANTPATDQTISAYTTVSDALVSSIESVLAARSPSSAIASNLSHILLDAYTSSATLRSYFPDLARAMPAKTQTLLLAILTASERRLASKTGKHIEVPRPPKRRAKPTPRPEDDDLSDAALAASPAASEDEASDAEPDEPPSLISDSDSDSGDSVSSAPGGDAAEAKAARRLAAALLAEQRLCALGGKLVLATLAGAVADERALRRRLELNRARLGPNWREVVRFLDAERKKAGAGKRKVAPSAPVVADIVVSDDDEEDEIEEVDSEMEE